MSRVHDGVVPQREQHVDNRPHQDLVIASGEVGSTDGSGKQRVPNKQVAIHLQADTALAMPRRVMHADLDVAEADRRPVVERVDGRLPADRDAEHLALLYRALIQGEVVLVQMNRHTVRPLRHIDAADVIEVRVREQDVLDVDLEGVHNLEELIDLVAGVDDDSLARALARHDETVLMEGRNRPRFENHPYTLQRVRCSSHVVPCNLPAMILCVVDDLLFSVKISTAAKALGVEISFERNADNVVSRVLEKAPTLVIFDLNSTKLRPMDAIAAMKADAGLRAIPTLGYVSHVQTETINLARQAGVDQVLARSAFVEQLGGILTRA